LNGTIRTNLEARETPIGDDVNYNNNDVFRSKLVLFPQIDMQTIVATQTVDEPPTLPATPSAVPNTANKAQVTAQATPNAAPVKIIVQTKKFYVYGLIEYDDVFGRHHETKFCYVNTPGAREWANCDKYNDAN